MAAITESQLKADVKSGKISNVYLLYGRDMYSAELYAKALKKRVVDENTADMNLHEFEGKGLDVSELADACEALPMFAEYNCCTVSNLDLSNKKDFPKEKYDMLISVIKNVPETTVLIIYYSSLDICSGKKRPDEAYNRLISNVTKYGTVCSFPVKTAADNAKTIASLAKKKQCTIGYNEAYKLAVLCAGDMLMINSELDKLAAYANGSPVTAEMIDLLCPGEDDTQIYELTDAVSKNDKQTAMRVYKELLDMRAEPIMLLYTVTGTIVDFYRARTALDNGKSAADVKADFGYQGYKSRGADNAFRSVNRVSSEHLGKCIDLLIECEIRMKTVSKELHPAIFEETIIKMLS